MEYVISGGKLYIDKKAFTRDLLVRNSSLKTILGYKSNKTGKVQPIITKTDDSVVLDYNNGAHIDLDEDFMDLFTHLKERYKEKMKGSITIRISLFNSYYTVLDLNSEDGEIIY